MVMVKTFSYHERDKGVIDVIEKLSHREGYRGFSSLVMNILAEYAKIHADGNPNFTLDQFSHEEMMAMPATMRPNQDWIEYMNKLDESTFRKLETKIYELKSISDKRWEKGFG